MKREQQQQYESLLAAATQVMADFDVQIHGGRANNHLQHVQALRKAIADCSVVRTRVSIADAPLLTADQRMALSDTALYAYYKCTSPRLDLLFTRDHGSSPALRAWIDDRLAGVPTRQDAAKAAQHWRTERGTHTSTATGSAFTEVMLGTLILGALLAAIIVLFALLDPAVPMAPFASPARTLAPLATPSTAPRR